MEGRTPQSEYIIAPSEWADLDKPKADYSKESTFETISLLLAVLAGTFIEGSLSNPIPLLEIEFALAFVGIALLVLLKKYHRPAMFKFGSVVITVANWLIAILAGSLFGTGFALVRLFWLVGIPITFLYFVFIVTVNQLSKTIHHEWEIKWKQEKEKVTPA